MRAIAMIVAVSMPVAADPGPGGPYKCSGESGRVVYQEAPCETGRTLRDLSRWPSGLSVIPLERPAGAAAPAPSRPVRAAVTGKDRDRGKSRAAFDASERRHVHEGQSEGEVLARLGAPDMQAGKTGRRMRWTYLPAPADPQTVTLVHFEDGKVKEVERRTLR
jgi:hypothetical protein